MGIFEKILWQTCQALNLSFKRDTYQALMHIFVKKNVGLIKEF